MPLSTSRLMGIIALILMVPLVVLHLAGVPASDFWLMVASIVLLALAIVI